MPPRLAAACSVACLLAACSDTVTLRWELAFESPEQRARAEEVEARIVRGGCDGDDAVWSARLARSAAERMDVPDLSPGTYGFEAVAIDGACFRFASACRTLELPVGAGDAVELTLAGEDGPVEREPGCARSCARPAPFDVEVTFRRTIWVSPDGDDEASGSEDAPVASIGRALALAHPDVVGEPVRVVLRAGTHVDPDRHYFGELFRPESSPLKLEGEPGAVLRAADGETSALYWQGLRYVVIEDLTLEGGEDPLRIERDGRDNERVVIRNVHVRGTPGSSECIRIYSANHLVVEHVEVEGCDYGIRLLAAHDSVVTGSTIRDSEGLGISVESASSDVLIHGNTFRNLGGPGVRLGGDSAIDFWIPDITTVQREATRIHVVGNVFESVGATDGQTWFASCDACTIANNTMVNPGRYLTRVLDTNADPRLLDTRDAVFVNNLVLFRAADLAGYVNLDDSPDARIAPETFTFGWNLFVPDEPDHPGFSTPAPIPTDDTSRVVPDAELVDAPAGDYRLRSGSPAVGEGTSVALGTPAPGDFASECWADPPSIGAFEAR